MVAEKYTAADQWYAIYTNAKEELRADKNLRAWNVATLSPRIRERRPLASAKQPTFVTKPLFPRYIFARFNSEVLHKVRYTRGVQGVVGFGSGPTPIADDIIDLIASRLDTEGCLSIASRFQPGERVSIEDGPLKNMQGIFEREMKADDRVMIMLDTIQFKFRAAIDPKLLRKAN